jgi:hypothetical protein
LLPRSVGSVNGEIPRISAPYHPQRVACVKVMSVLADLSRQRLDFEILFDDVRDGIVSPEYAAHVCERYWKAVSQCAQ